MNCSGPIADQVPDEYAPVDDYGQNDIGKMLSSFRPPTGIILIEPNSNPVLKTSASPVLMVPNVLLIVADDLGFSDIGSFGSEIKTPNLDKLASNGIRLTDFHTAAACSPTRSMLLSGTDNHIAGVGVMAEQKRHNRERWNAPGHEGYLNYRVAALPELLQESGYTTIISGKWHLGLKPDYIPSKRGFDKSFALLPGCANHYGWEPQFGDDRNEFMDHFPTHPRSEPNTTNNPQGFFSSDHYADKLIDFLEERPKEKPFFAFLPFSAPHWPLQADKRWRAKYEGRYNAGPEVLRQERLAHLKELGLVSKDVVPHDVVSPEKAEWDEMTDDERALSARAMETYAGMVENMDWNIGRVLDYVEKSGEKDNTLIIFMSDNGAEGASFEALPTHGNDLMRVINKFYNNELDNIGEHNSFVWYGPRWAQAATAPSRLYKMFSTEGGIRVPFILNYPPWTKSRAGAVLDSFATVMDLAPTILDLAGIKHPGEGGTFRGRQVVGLRGKSWSNYFQSNEQASVTSLHGSDNPIVGWELFGRAALRQGKWKIVFLPAGPYGKGQWELFDLEEDPGETKDLSGSEPDKTKDLLKLWDEYVRETGVVWGEPLKVGPVEVDTSGPYASDPLEDARAWMLSRSRGQLGTTAA